MTLRRFVFIWLFVGLAEYTKLWRNLTEKFWEEIIMNRKLKTDFRFLLTKATQNCRLGCHAFYCVLCVCKLLLCICVLANILASIYIHTHTYRYIYECFIEKEFSHNENGKFQFILSTL